MHGVTLLAYERRGRDSQRSDLPGRDMALPSQQKSLPPVGFGNDSGLTVVTVGASRQAALAASAGGGSR